MVLFCPKGERLSYGIISGGGGGGSFLGGGGDIPM